MRKPIEAFNARALPPARVAETFVPPSYFRDLLGLSHSVIAGPRGSGKTTLLKMLTREALDKWNANVEEAQQVSVDFFGVFIPTDIAWQAQVEALGTELMEPSHQSLLQRSVFSGHILRAFVRSVLYEFEAGLRIAPPNKSLEAQISEGLAEEWGLDLRVPSLRGLLASLEARLYRIREFAMREGLRPERGRAERLADNSDLRSSFVEPLAVALTVISAVDGLDRDDRWALCFDELELAPASITEELLQALRSTDERLLFKLSFAPYGEEVRLLEAALSATSNDDYHVELLTYGRKESAAKDFAERVLEALFDRSGVSVSPVVALGTGIEDGDTYSLGSEFYDSVLDLQRTDPSFEQYLQRHGIRLNEAFSSAAAPPALRKARQVIPIREAYRWSGESTRARRSRSRKNPDLELYRGLSAFLAMTEGNPRLTVSMASRLIAEVGDGRTVSPTALRTIVGAASANFMTVLRTMPSTWRSRDGRWYGVAGLVELLGRYFHSRIVSGEFNPEPHGSFTVDSNDASLLDALGKAVNAGAIVVVPSRDESKLLSSLEGRRFRLSFLLSPLFGLPTRLGPETQISRILAAEADDLGAREDQLDLFGELDADS